MLDLCLIDIDSIAKHGFDLFLVQLLLVFWFAFKYLCDL